MGGLNILLVDGTSAVLSLGFVSGSFGLGGHLFGWMYIFFLRSYSLFRKEVLEFFGPMMFYEYLQSSKAETN